MSVSSLRSFEYLEQLPGTVFRRLYQQPSTALAVFRRMLPHLGTCTGQEHEWMRNATLMMMMGIS